MSLIWFAAEAGLACAAGCAAHVQKHRLSLWLSLSIPLLFRNTDSLSGFLFLSLSYLAAIRDEPGLLPLYRKKSNDDYCMLKYCNVSLIKVVELTT